MAKFWTLVTEEKGIQHAEEALLLALIAVVAVGILGTLGGKISSVFTEAEAGMDPPA